MATATVEKKRKPETNGEAEKKAPDHEAAFHDRVRKAREKVRLAALSESARKADYKEAKAQHEVAVSQLLRIIDDGDQPDLPFADDDATGRAWRDVPIREALEGLPLGIYEKLNEAEIVTMGQYSDYCEKNARAVGSGEHPLVKIKGIGPGKVEQVQAAEAKFWELWKDRLDEPAEPEAEADGEAAAEPDEEDEDDEDE